MELRIWPVRTVTALFYISQRNQQDWRKKQSKLFLSARVDGILASIAKETVDFTHYTELKKRNIPVVFFDRTNEKLNVPAVVIDDYKGAYLATEHLLKNG